MEIFRFEIKPQAEIDRDVRIQAFKKAQMCCPLCQSDLQFETQTSIISFQSPQINVTEKARCPSCAVMIREEIHQLQ